MSDRATTVYSEALPVSGAPVRCQLVVIEGPDQGRATVIGDQELIVGSEASADLVLTDDRVSARHLSIRAEDGRFVLTDLDSKNGTLYEGSRIAQAAVPPGATLRLGRSFLRILPDRQPLSIQPSQARRFGELYAESLAMREVFAVLELAADADVTVLLEGETGTGKELAARAIHEHSARKQGPFVAIDCGALPESLLESELFGHVRGAFTGASTARDGAFARAHGGTLFLDELAGISPAVQARLLRAIEEKKVRAVGSDVERPVDVRVIGAAGVDLLALVAEGSFRADLVYRLSVLRVVLPPLRARREDLPILVRTLLARRGLPEEGVEGPNLHRLMAHAWRGNVRELRNVLDRAIALTPSAKSFGELRISLDPQGSEDPLAIRSDLPFGTAKEAILHAFERRYLADVLARCEGNISATARETELDRKHLRSLLRKHELIRSGEEE
ncbi:MAG: sigma 54-interacting transcriptional regulator [Myxococcota bacterium]